MKRSILWIVLSVLSILYGLAVLAAGSGTLFFAVWLVFGAGFFLLSVGARRNWWKRFPKGIKTFLVSVLVVALAGFLFIEAFVLSGFRYRPKEDVDYLIVLGAQVREDGPSAVL